MQQNYDVNPLISNHQQGITYRLKFFPYNNHLIITLDIGNDSTRIIDLDLDNYTSRYDKIPYPGHNKESFVVMDTPYCKGNSFFFEGKLFQFIVSNKNILFSVTDIKTKKILTEYSLSKDISTGFFNSPMNYFIKSSPDDSAKVKKNENEKKYILDTKN